MQGAHADCDDLEGWGEGWGRSEAEEGGDTHTHTHTHTYLWLIRVIQQRPTQHCKGIPSIKNKK